MASLSLSKARIAADAVKASNSVTEIKNMISEVDTKDDALMDWMTSRR
jgi:hypothetical protein